MGVNVFPAVSASSSPQTFSVTDRIYTSTSSVYYSRLYRETVLPTGTYTFEIDYLNDTYMSGTYTYQTEITSVNFISVATGDYIAQIMSPSADVFNTGITDLPYGRGNILHGRSVTLNEPAFVEITFINKNGYSGNAAWLSFCLRFIQQAKKFDLTRFVSYSSSFTDNTYSTFKAPTYGKNASVATMWDYDNSNFAFIPLRSDVDMNTAYSAPLYRWNGSNFAFSQNVYLYQQGGGTDMWYYGFQPIAIKNNKMYAVHNSSNYALYSGSQYHNFTKNTLTATQDSTAWSIVHSSFASNGNGYRQSFYHDGKNGKIIHLGNKGTGSGNQFLSWTEWDIATESITYTGTKWYFGSFNYFDSPLQWCPDVATKRQVALQAETSYAQRHVYSASSGSLGAPSAYARAKNGTATNFSLNTQTLGGLYKFFFNGYFIADGNAVNKSSELTDPSAASYSIIYAVGSPGNPQSYRNLSCVSANNAGTNGSGQTLFEAPNGSTYLLFANVMNISSPNSTTMNSANGYTISAIDILKLDSDTVNQITTKVGY